EDALPPGARAVAAPVPGSVWQVLKAPGSLVAAGETLMILESMKMEVRVSAPAAGRLAMLSANPGTAVRAGQRLCVIQPE
ncbi:MAG TPA: acetyl-CoA carboxylase biotin carboxyl carrier protein subunit, partial [Acidocella sp.]|nr:acetyl-CoA carboxylase biotin carboxyl carrier protein subunit [Acidocella sp.]